MKDLTVDVNGRKAQFEFVNLNSNIFFIKIRFPHFEVQNLNLSEPLKMFLLNCPCFCSNRITNCVTLFDIDDNFLIFLACYPYLIKSMSLI